ncbi:hypothetical protein FKP32DRAFT_116309 [Trametes sanguinea]|nr:hypothetical protein FKP32DRAFT_116309 [Trametes sanguinea]
MMEKLVADGADVVRLRGEEDKAQDEERRDGRAGPQSDGVAEGGAEGENWRADRETALGSTRMRIDSSCKHEAPSATLPHLSRLSLLNRAWLQSSLQSANDIGRILAVHVWNSWLFRVLACSPERFAISCGENLLECAFSLPLRRHLHWRPSPATCEALPIIHSRTSTHGLARSTSPVSLIQPTRHIAPLPATTYPNMNHSTLTIHGRRAVRRMPAHRSMGILVLSYAQDYSSAVRSRPCSSNYVLSIWYSLSMTVHNVNVFVEYLLDFVFFVVGSHWPAHVRDPLVFSILRTSSCLPPGLLPC